MALVDRLVALFPVAISFIAMVLSALCLFSGNNKGFMEEYAVARINITGIGPAIIDTTKSGGGLWDVMGNSISNEVSALVGGVADEVTHALGVGDWYSLHVMDACEGYYKTGSSYNVTSCTASGPNNRLNLTNLIQQKLDHAPVPGVKLSALGWSSDVQDQLDKVTDVLFALFVLYAMSMGLTGLSMLGGLLAAACQPNPRPLVVANLGSASLGTLALAVASVVVSVVATRGVDTVNAKAGVMGVQAEPGWELLVLSWVAAAVALVVTLFWALRLVLQKRRAASEAAAAAAAAAAEEKGGEDKGE